MRLRAFALACALLAAAVPAVAQPRQDSLGAGWREQQDEARKGVQQGGNVSLAQVIENINRMTPGRQLDAGLEAGPDGRPVYRVRWATKDGRRIDFLVDARTGQILSQGGG